CAPLEKIKANLVNKLLRTLDEMKTKERDAYLEFYNELGVLLKEGAVQDREHRPQLAELLFFQSTKTEAGKLTSLGEYVERMAGDQAEMYYVSGEHRELSEHSPHLETFKSREVEVLLLLDPVADFLIQARGAYPG